MKKKYFNVIFAILVLASMFLLSDRSVSVMRSIFATSSNVTEDTAKWVIVIDAGHGGFDPGKVGVNGAKEKDINLAIAKELKDILEKNDFKVVMTRETDDGLYEEGEKNKKASDMRRRVVIIEETKPDLAISIHQNSFPQESSHGAQVFYYKTSVEGEKFAKTMQSTIKEYIADDNHRLEKANQDYYMLKKTSCPFIIVECGFLSNYKEAEQLTDSEYQRKMAWAIHLGIMRYLSLKEG